MIEERIPGGPVRQHIIKMLDPTPFHLMDTERRERVMRCNIESLLHDLVHEVASAECWRPRGREIWMLFYQPEISWPEGIPTLRGESGHYIELHQEAKEVVMFSPEGTALLRLYWSCPPIQ